MSYPKFFTGLLIFLLTLPAHVSARDSIVGLSTSQTPAALEAQVERLIGHAVATLEPRQAMRFFDASHPGLIATFTAPDGAGAGNPRAMVQANRMALGQLKQFIDAAAPDPNHAGHIHLPEFFRFIRQNHAVVEDGADIIVLGAPITDDHQAPSTTMQNGRVPNDGHIAAHVGQSIYATTGLTGSLAGYDVYLGLIGELWEVSEAHAYHVERVWSLTAERHDASLAYFGDDLNTLFAMAGKDVVNRTHPQPLMPMEKLEMLQFAPDNGAVADIFTRPLEVAPAPRPIWESATSPRIGITWEQQDADIDLYVRPNPTAEVIYFGNASTQQGRLFKDFQNSPASGFETVQLNGTVDLSQVYIALNYYSGSSPQGLSGELRIAIGDQVWAAPFTIPATSGNRGQGVIPVLRDQIPSSDAWIILEPIDVLGEE